ncbi:MAG TPA: FtsX-like permease family protein [Acidobacteriota bacterium]|nr:FtsX-like permease family protein [Acidobacteriota bacterium]
MGVLTRAIKNISRRKMRALLVIIALGFSMAILISVPAGIVANQTATQALTENFNKTLSDMQAEINKTMTLIEISNSSSSMPGNPFGNSSGFMPGPMFGGSQSYMNASIIYDARSIEGVMIAIPYLEKSEGVNETMTRFGRSFTVLRTKYTIVGVSLNSSLIDNYSILPANITDGRNLQEGDSGVVLLSENNTEYFGVIVGDKVTILGKSFTVVGVHGSTGFSESTMLYMNITDAQTITGLTGSITKLDVYAENSSDVDDIATQIEALYPELSITTYKDRLSQLDSMQSMYESTLTTAQSTLSQTEATAVQEILIAVVATSLIVLFVMLYTVRERTKEIGTLKAIGFSNWNVMSQFMLEGTLLSLIAGVVGIAIGSIGAPMLTSVLLPSISTSLFGGSSRGFGPDSQPTSSGIAGAASTQVTLSPQLMLLALGAAVLLGALGSLYPAWRASRTKPAESMKYE